MQTLNVTSLRLGGYQVTRPSAGSYEMADVLAAFSTLDEALQFVRQQMNGSVQQSMSASEQAAHLLASQRAQVQAENYI